MSPDDASPFIASFRQRHCTFACASASWPVTARSCRSNRPSRALRADPDSAIPARSSPPRRRSRVRRGSIRGFLRPGASPEVFVPFSTHWPRRVLPGAAGLRTIPLRRFRQPWPALVPGPPPGVRPCGFSLRRTAAMVLDAGRTLAGGAFRSNPSPAPSPFDWRPARRRVDDVLLASRSSYRSLVWGGDGVPVLFPRPRATRPARAPPLRFCRPSRVIRRRVPWRGVPYPLLTRAFAA
jgi:hypothetical protein